MDEIREGDMVKCINDNFKDTDAKIIRGISLPKKDEIYTVRETLKVRGERGLLFEEIWNNEHYNEEPAFRGKRFKPYSK